MTHVRAEAHDPYFFSQRKNRRFQRRLRKSFDDYSLYGERKETLLTFKGGWDAESVVSGGRWRRPSSATIRPGTAARRVSLKQPQIALPAVDPTGPNLVAAEPILEAVETKSTLSEKRVEFLQAVEEKEKSSLAEKGQKYKFSEAKFGSSSVLSNLSKFLYSISDNFSVSIPVELVNSILQDYQQLTSDVVTEKREWQTDCYLDFQLKNKRPFLTAVPEEEGLRERLESSIRKIAKKQEKEKNKRVRLSRESMWKKCPPDSSPERPQTARSVLSNFSFHSDISRSASVEERQEYDMLPAELRPTILHYRRESAMPRARSTGPKTRLEKFKSMQRGTTGVTTAKKKGKLTISVKPTEKLAEEDRHEEQPEPSGIRQNQVTTTINFSMGSFDCQDKGITSFPGRSHLQYANTEGEDLGDLITLTLQEGLQDSSSGTTPRVFTHCLPDVTARDEISQAFHLRICILQAIKYWRWERPGNKANKGWLVIPSEMEDPEANTLRMWERQLKELMRKREEAKLIAKQRGEDGPLVVKFYNDPQIRTLRLKHQRSATFPLPAVFSKLPPSVASFMLPSANEALLIGEGLRVFVLVLPDGSACSNYYSGRQAVCASRSGDVGSRGLYTVVYDDREDHALLGYFTPTGRACCYHRSGNLHMLSNLEGGSLFDEDGAVVRKWVWPPPNHKLPVTVSIQLNAHLSFQCSSLSTMVLRFSSRGQNHKFPVGPPPDSLEEHRIPFEVGGQSDELLTDAPFSSRAAWIYRQKTQTQSTLPPPPAKKGRTLHSRVHSVVSEDEGGSSLLLDCEHLSKDLATYKDKIKSVIDDWMGHYRQNIGINLPTRMISILPRSSSSSRSPSRGIPSWGRRIHSSMSYVGETFHSHSPTRSGHARHFTHPLPSPRTSPTGEFRSRSPLLAALGVSEGSRAISPCLPRPASPLDCIQRPPSMEPCKPFKVGTSKPHKKASIRLKCGCPVALHSMLLRDLDIMPPCKCDKRRPPYISDLEYDIFLQSHVPRDQLLIICVLSSIMESSCPCEPMLDAIHYSQNRIRFSPCTQCVGDAFRLVKYDLCRALKGLSRTQPLLVERHNAAPGMFLMYMGGQLVHADYMFNGYGTTKRDFMKQIQLCMEDGRKGHFLPSDFKFTRQTGTKIPGSSTWAYPIAGVLEDLVPFTPASSHSSSNSQHSLLEPEGSRLLVASESKLTMDYLGFSTGDVLQLSVCSGLDSSSQVSNFPASAVSVVARES